MKRNDNNYSIALFCIWFFVVMLNVRQCTDNDELKGELREIKHELRIMNIKN